MAIPLLMQKEKGALRPADLGGEAAFHWLGKVKEGEYVVVEARDTARRATKQLRYCHAVLTAVFESSESLQKWAGNYDNFRGEVLIRLGYCDYVKQKDGSVNKYPWSMKLVGGMDAATFNEFVDKMWGLLNELGYGDEFRREVEVHAPAP